VNAYRVLARFIGCGLASLMLTRTPTVPTPQLASTDPGGQTLARCRCSIPTPTAADDVHQDQVMPSIVRTGGTPY
jgi:hypothetical protein